MLGDFIKQWGALGLVCGSIVGFVSFIDRFETVTAAEQKWAAHNQALICKTVSDLRQEIRALEIEAKHADTADMRDFLLAQIQQIRDEIARIDPDGVC